MQINPQTVEECECCVEKYKQSEVFKCICNYLVCKNCLYIYLDGIIELKCMNCNIFLDEDIVENLFNKKKYDDIKRKRVDTVFEMEKSLFGETQEIISKIKEKKIALTGETEKIEYKQFIDECLNLYKEIIYISEEDSKEDKEIRTNEKKLNNEIKSANKKLLKEGKIETPLVNIKKLNTINNHLENIVTTRDIVNNICSNITCVITDKTYDQFLTSSILYKYLKVIKLENLNIINDKVNNFIAKYPGKSVKLFLDIDSKKDIIKKDIKSLEQGKYINEILPEIKEDAGLIKYNCNRANCKGMLNRSYECNLCETKHCRKCKEIKDEDHECDENILESVRLIYSETKPCPSCKVPIFKISGCHQMWCTNCKLVAFDWVTGKVLHSKNIHNPHLIEYQNSIKEVEIVKGEIKIKQLDDKNFCDEILRLRVWINDHLDSMERYNANDNFKLRVRYLKNEITEKAFKTEIMKRNTFMFRTSKLSGIYQKINFKINNFLLLINKEEAILSKLFKLEYDKFLVDNSKDIDKYIFNGFEEINFKTLTDIIYLLNVIEIKKEYGKEYKLIKILTIIDNFIKDNKNLIQFSIYFKNEKEKVMKEIHDMNIELLSFNNKYDRNVMTIKYNNTNFTFNSHLLGKEFLV